MDHKAFMEDTSELMSKSVEFYKNQLSKVRTGRATTALVDSVRADYYGAPTALSQMASVSVPDPKTIVIQPWDRGTIQAIEKAIQQADLGFNPQSDGSVIRISVPPLTQERRKEFVKLSKKYSEETKIAIRNIRREQLELLRKQEKDKDISEDDLKRGEDEVQKVTDEFIKDVDKLFTVKEKELLEV